MPFTFNAVDSQFATATGAHVGTGPDRSHFDGPSSQSTGMTITSHDGDSDPRLFEVGESYSVSYMGPDGPVTIANAVVMRSDAAPVDGSASTTPNDAGVIVLGGLDQNGHESQIVWTPEFNLEQWNTQALDQGSPAFYTADQQGDYNHRFVCFAAETRIVARGGLAPAREIVPGRLLRTLDAGLQPVAWRGQRCMAGRRAAAPVLFAPGTIGNDAPPRLSQQHRVLLRSVRAELMFGRAEVLVPAKALVNGESIPIAPAHGSPMATCCWTRITSCGPRARFARACCWETRLRKSCRPRATRTKARCARPGRSCAASRRRRCCDL